MLTRSSTVDVDYDRSRGCNHSINHLLTNCFLVGWITATPVTCAVIIVAYSRVASLTYHLPMTLYGNGSTVFSWQCPQRWRHRRYLINFVITVAWSGTSWINLGRTTRHLPHPVTADARDREHRSASAAEQTSRTTLEPEHRQWHLVRWIGKRSAVDCTSQGAPVNTGLVVLCSRLPATVYRRYLERPSFGIGLLLSSTVSPPPSWTVGVNFQFYFCLHMGNRANTICTFRNVPQCKTSSLIFLCMLMPIMHFLPWIVATILRLPSVRKVDCQSLHRENHITSYFRVKPLSIIMSFY